MNVTRARAVAATLIPLLAVILTILALLGPGEPLDSDQPTG